MSKPLSYRQQVECLILAIESEVESLSSRVDEVADEMESMNAQSQIYAMKYGYADALLFERVELRRILLAAKNAFEERKAFHTSRLEG